MRILSHFVLTVSRKGSQHISCDASVLIAIVDDKPGKMPIERCSELQRLLGQANSFINSHERERSALGDFGGPEELAGLSLDELRDEVMQLRSRAPDAPHAAASSSGPAAVVTGQLMLLSVPWMIQSFKCGFRTCMTDWCALHCIGLHWIADEARRKLEEEVLTELAGHPTVVYIRGLEDECEGYREALAVRPFLHFSLPFVHFSSHHKYAHSNQMGVLCILTRTPHCRTPYMHAVLVLTYYATGRVEAHPRPTCCTGVQGQDCGQAQGATAVL